MNLARVVNLAETLEFCKRIMKDYGFKKLNEVLPGGCGVIIDMDTLAAYKYRNGLLGGITGGASAGNKISQKLLEAEVAHMADEFVFTLSRRLAEINAMPEEARAKLEANAASWYDWRQPVEEAVMKLHDNGMRVEPRKKPAAVQKNLFTQKA
jgi:hypothetical protein